MSEGDEEQEASASRKIGALPSSEAELLEDDPAPTPESADTEDTSTTSLNMAVQEAFQLSSGRSASDLEKEAAAKEHARSQAFRDNFERIAITVLWVLFLSLVASAGIWLWHLLTPASWHWLSQSQLSTIQNIITGGIIAAAIGDHFKRRLT